MLTAYEVRNIHCMLDVDMTTGPGFNVTDVVYYLTHNGQLVGTAMLIGGAEDEYPSVSEEYGGTYCVVLWDIPEVPDVT